MTSLRRSSVKNILFGFYFLPMRSFFFFRCHSWKSKSLGGGYLLWRRDSSYPLMTSHCGVDFCDGGGGGIDEDSGGEVDIEKRGVGSY